MRQTGLQNAVDRISARSAETSASTCGSLERDAASLKRLRIRPRLALYTWKSSTPRSSSSTASKSLAPPAGFDSTM